MESVIASFFTHNWQRKLLALVTGILIWFFVSHSITETKVIDNVPIRISNLPPDKTVVGLLPNGILRKRINLTLTGSKDVMDDIESGDLEINIDASNIDHDDWVIQINKKNLFSLNPSIDLANKISSISHNEYIIKLRRLVTTKIPVEILPPTGEAPPGYEFLDIWPQQLMQTISGPEEEIDSLKSQGLKLSFDLNEISKVELDSIKSTLQSGNNNEVSFPVPSKWKQITIPFLNYVVTEVNDPESQNLRIDFLRQETIPIERRLPIYLFYPTDNLEQINPENTDLSKEDLIQIQNGISLFSPQLYVKNVSRLFMSVIQDYVGIVIVAGSLNPHEILPWSLGVVTPHDLEETYVAYQMAHSKQVSSNLQRQREILYRTRFRTYLQRLGFYISADHKLHIESSIQNGKVVIHSY